MGDYGSVIGAPFSFLQDYDHSGSPVVSATQNSSGAVVGATNLGNKSVGATGSSIMPTSSSASCVPVGAATRFGAATTSAAGLLGSTGNAPSIACAFSIGSNTTPSFRLPMIRSKMGDMVSPIRNDLHSPPPIERANPCPSFLGLQMRTPPRPKTRKSLKHSMRSHNNAGWRINKQTTSLCTPRPMKRNTPLPLLLMDQDGKVDSVFNRPVSPPISESPPLSHNPLFKANDEFFKKLKNHFFTSPWWKEVNEILEVKQSSRFVFMLLERIVTPPEYFYSWCVEFFFQHHPTSFEDFLQRMKNHLQGVWDDRLYKHVNSFYGAANAFSQESGVGDSYRSTTTRKTPDLPDLKWEAVVQPVRPKSQPVATHSPKRKRRSTRSASKKRRYMDDLKRFEQVRQLLVHKQKQKQKRRKLASASQNTSNISRLLV